MYQRKREKRKKISPNECLMYQLIESCLKLNLDYNVAVDAINVIMKKCSYLFDKKHKTVRTKKMDYRNYRRYITSLKTMSPVHQELYKELTQIEQGSEEQEQQKDNNNNNYEMGFLNYHTKRPPDIIQIENLLFLLNDDTNKNKEQVPYREHVKVNTDDLIIKALIYMDKKYVF
jgi:hypothetical protein